MGKLTLLLVVAAMAGGTLLTLSTRQMAGETARGRAETQADLLARQVAESAQALAIDGIMGSGQLVAPRILRESPPAGGVFTYGGGTFTVEYAPRASNQEATVTVRAKHGDAEHTIRSEYRFVPFSYPGPIWMEAPYGTAAVSSGAKVLGGPIHVDRRPFDEINASMNLNSLGLSLPTMESQLKSAFAPTGQPTNVHDVSPFLEDLNVMDANGLYQVALSAMKPTDVTFDGNQDVTASYSIGSPTSITRVTGSLTIGGQNATGVHASGKGLLIVEGALNVRTGNRFTWDGLVLVRSTQQHAPVSFTGQTDIKGGLILMQQAYPPGGHLDFTVWRDMNGLSTTNPMGNRVGSPWNNREWFQHKHAFDLTVAEGSTVYLAEQGKDRHETWSRFRQFLNGLGTEEVYLEFVRPGAHGFSTFTLDIGQPGGSQSGTVRAGFGLLADGVATRTQRFQANKLRTLVVDVRSLRALKPAFDGPACKDWPVCIGKSFGRGESLTVRLVRVSTGRPVYEAAFYWHMRLDEVQKHEDKEKAWREQILAGEGFGTRLSLGAPTSVEYNRANVLALADRLRFKGDRIVHLGTTTAHVTASERRAQASTPGTR